MKCRRMGIEKTIIDPKNLNKIAVASKWVAEVSSAASDLLNLIVSLIANSSVDRNSASCITKLFPSFDPEKDKPGCLLTEKFLRALLSAVSSERKLHKEFPIIAKAVELVYFDEAGGIPNGPKKARTRLCRKESCELLRAILLNYVAKEMLVSVNNWYNVGQIQHQTAFFKQNFNLTNKVAKVFQKRVGTSKQAYVNNVCLAYSVSLATQIRHIKHRIIEKQNNGGTKSEIAKLQKEEANQILKRSKFDANTLIMGTPLFEKAEKEFQRYNKFPDEKVERRGWDNTEVKRTRVENPELVELLLEYVNKSKENIPKDEGQFASIKYSYEMIKDLDTVVSLRNKSVKIPKYAPTKSISPCFITIDKAQLSHLLSLEDGREVLKAAKQIPLNSTPEALNFFFDINGSVRNQIPETPISTTETTLTSSSSANQSTPTNNHADGNALGSEDSNPELATQVTAESLSTSVEWKLILKNIDLNDAMPFLFRDKMIKRFVANRRTDDKKRFFANSFQAGPVQLCLKVITEDEVINNRQKQTNIREKKASNAAEKNDQEKKEKEKKDNETEEDIPIDIDVVNPVTIPVTKPDDKTKAKMNKSTANEKLIEIGGKEYKVQHFEGAFWGIDFGLSMVFGAYHSTNAFPPFSISRKEFNNNVGVTNKNHLQEKDFKKRMESDETFKAAVTARTEHNFKTSNSDKLLQAVISNIGNFHVMYTFYGNKKFALDRFMNRNNQEREFARIVDLLFVGDVKHLVCGDATMPNGLKGSQTSLDKKFCEYVERVKGKGTIVFCSEHRSSILDSNTRKAMYNPTMPLSKKKIKKRKLREERNASQVAEEVPDDAMEVDADNPLIESWGGGGDRIARLAKIGSKGARIFRQEWKAREVGVGKEGEEGWSDESRVWGLYQVSMPGYSYLWNRDINAAINIVNIYLHLLEFDVEPWEFRKDVQLFENPVYIPTKTCQNSTKFGSLAAVM